MATLLSAAGPSPSTLTWKRAIDEATGTASDARIVILDLHNGRILASHHLDEAARTLAAPGSAIKPIILYKLLASGRWNAERRIACDRSLAVAGHRLACSHPAAPPFDARTALAWSCNSYFAGVAHIMRSGELGPMLRPTGLLGATGLAHDEAVADFQEPRTPEEMQLAVLGVDSIRVTPLELASAYRWLATELALHTQTIAATTVSGGLADSAESGMAQPARQAGNSVAGKTGSAESAGSHRTHGWFAGFAPAAHPWVVIVVFVPSGRGVDAAHIAGRLLALAPITEPKAKLP
jgi:penicillin-binding protein 2